MILSVVLMYFYFWYVTLPVTAIGVFLICRMILKRKENSGLRYFKKMQKKRLVLPECYYFIDGKEA